MRALKYYFKKYKKEILIILLGIILSIFNMIFIKNDIKLTHENKIKKEDYTGMDYSIPVYVYGLFNKRKLIDIPVERKKYTNREIDKIFDECIKALPNKILGENISEDKINTKLNFIKYIPEYDVDIAIIPEDTDLIDFSGEILNTDLKSKKETYLNIILSYGDRSTEFKLRLTIIPSDNKDEKYIINSFLKEIKNENEKQKNSDYLVLPEKWKGKDIKYKSKENYDYIYIFIFFLLLLVLIKFNERYKEKQKKIFVEKENLLEYPEIISKFIVYIEAGLSIRNIWEKIVMDYEKNSLLSKHKIDVYEKMKKAYLRLKSGMHEAIVYKKFSREVGLRQYTKFVSILEQNRKTGLTNIKDLLITESKEAWEQRIQLAKRQGQEAQTKLLLPLFIMLLIVLVIVVAPAMLNMY